MPAGTMEEKGRDNVLVKFEGFDFIDGGVCAPKGFQASGVHCGIRKNKEKKDLALIFCEKDCTAAACYTQNKVKGAPILVTRQNLSDGKARAVICNSGNANTCNADGEEKAQRMCELVSQKLPVDPKDVIVASTGVIGQPLPIEAIEGGMDALVAALGRTPQQAQDAAFAIMTTDTRKKEIAVSFRLGGKECRLAGMAKGSGMIHPNMATMLCFLTTDVCIEADVLQKALSRVTKVTFNRVSIDGDTSTNDMVSILASGLAGNACITYENEDYEIFVNALYVLLMNLSREIARDGEGATKLLECVCTGAEDEETAETIAKAVITSNLLKAAMFAADANWGRILCAIGYADASFDIVRVSVDLASSQGTIRVCENGSGVAFSEEQAKTILNEDEIRILVNVGEGKGRAVAWGCDLTYDYVKINADYRT